MTKVIAIANQKGGVGKTTAAIMAAVTLGLGTHKPKENKKKSGKVLFVDLDSQRNGSYFFLRHAGMNSKRGDSLPINPKCDNKNVYDVSMPLRGEKFLPYPTEFDNVDILPNDGRIDDLASIIGAKGNVDDGNQITILAKIINIFIESMGDYYDYVIFDTPPSLTSLQQSSILASDYVLLVTVLEHFSSAAGIPSTIETIEDFNTYTRPEKPINILGILVNRIRYANREENKLQNKQQKNLVALNEAFPKLMSENLRLTDLDTYKWEEMPNRENFFGYMKKPESEIEVKNFFNHIYKKLAK